MTVPDPLADVLADAFAELDVHTSIAAQFEGLARAARDHIAVEIEAVEDAQPPMLRNSLGLRDAARIARRDTP